MCSVGTKTRLDPDPFSPSTPPPWAHTYTQQGNGFFPQDVKTLPRQKDGARARSSFQPSLKGHSTSLDHSLRGQGFGDSDRKTPHKPQRRLSPGDCSTESHQPPMRKFLSEREIAQNQQPLSQSVLPALIHAQVGSLAGRSSVEGM